MEVKHDKDNVYCNDENCVRCNKYNTTVLLAWREISKITNRVISFKIQKGLDSIARSLDKKRKQRPNIFYYDCLSAHPIWNRHQKAEIKDCSLLEKSFDTIFKEFKFIYDNQHLGGIWKKNSTPQGSWDVFHLINQGSHVQENQDMCPATMEVINQLPSAMRQNVFGNVMFSILKPGTVISPHYGPTNIRLRCHLGLEVPVNCLLKVDSQTTSWEQGRCIVFDDSFLHSVEYKCTDDNSEETSVNRTVLIVDLWHPDISDEERQAFNRCFQSHT